jgi:hypothetical protein
VGAEMVTEDPAMVVVLGPLAPDDRVTVDSATVVVIGPLEPSVLVAEIVDADGSVVDNVPTVSVDSVPEAELCCVGSAEENVTDDAGPFEEPVIPERLDKREEQKVRYNPRLIGTIGLGDSNVQNTPEETREADVVPR